MKFCVILLSFLFFLSQPSFAEHSNNVLIIHSYHDSYKWTKDIQKSLDEELGQLLNTNIFIEHMDTKRFADKEYYTLLKDFYAKKYKNISFNLIITSDDNAFNFAKELRESIFSPNIPLLFCGVNYLDVAHTQGVPNTSGVNEEVDIGKNFELITTLHPRVKNIYIIMDTTTTGKKMRKATLEAINNFRLKNISFEIIDDITLKELKTKLLNLPKDSAILLTLFIRAKDNEYFEHDVLSTLINKLSDTPLYGVWDFNLEHGIIGGYLASGLFQGKTLAAMAKQVLQGQDINKIPIVYASPNEYMFDYKQFQKYHIDIKQLPQNSFIIDKPNTFIQKYQRHLIATSVVFLFLIIFIIILLINIKKRKDAEQKISKQLDFQQKLIDNVNAPIYYKNKDGIFIGCNKAFEKLLEKKKQDIIGKTSYSLWDKDFADFYNTQDAKLMADGVAQKYESSVNISNKKEYRDLLFYKNVFYHEGHIDGMIGAIFDITELKKVSNALSELNLKLEEKVKNRTQELELSNENLQKSISDLKKAQDQLVESEKMASLGSLVAGVAHEINTPVGIGLTGITHFLSEVLSIKEKFEKEDLSEEEFVGFIEKSQEIATLINTNLERTANLVKSFKQVAIDQSNDIQRKINMKEYINEVLFSLTNITKKTNVTINVLCDDKLEVTTYPGAFAQIITNLVLNSINHAYDDKGKGIVNITIKKIEDVFSLEYSDDGRGIDKAILPKIFEPFFTTNRQHGGTGLGLNIIYNIITNKLNGTIKCESEKGKGTKFFITFYETKGEKDG